MRNLVLKKTHSLPYGADEKVNLSLFQLLSVGWRLNRRLVGLWLNQVGSTTINRQNTNQSLRYADFPGHACVK